MTSILLEVTNEEIATISDEVYTRAKQKESGLLYWNFKNEKCLTLLSSFSNLIFFNHIFLCQISILLIRFIQTCLSNSFLTMYLK